VLMLHAHAHAHAHVHMHLMHARARVHAHVHVCMPMCTYVHLAATLQLIAKKPGAHKDMIWSQSSLVLTHTHPSPVTLIVALVCRSPQPPTTLHSHKPRSQSRRVVT
jgi:hypothetical protein